MIRNDKIEIFLESLSSKDPTPGGGSAAALVGAMGASLVEMVANLTIEKNGYENVQSEVKKIKIEARRLRKRLLELSDKDSLAFKKVMKAYRTKNDRNIQKSLKLATEIPLETALLCAKVNKLTKIIKKIGNRNTSSDSASALYLTKAAVLSALENVKINLDGVKDTDWKIKIEDKIKSIKYS
jgi:formiminotetrahydrofolate cyclodeaminase